MKEMSHASFAAAPAISPEFWYSTSFSGTRSFAAAAFASSTVTPRGCPEAGSRVAQNVEAAGPTATATRSDPVGAMSRAEESSSAATTEPVAPTSRASAVSDRYAALEMFLFMLSSGCLHLAPLAGRGRRALARRVRGPLHGFSGGVRLGPPPPPPPPQTRREGRQ